MRKRPIPPRCDLTASDDDRARDDDHAAAAEPTPAEPGPAEPTPAEPAVNAERRGEDSAEPELEPTLAGQIGRTRDAFSRLINAHIELLKAELGAILGQIAKMATFGSVAFVLLLTMANMLYIGGFLFLGEWLFGSMGWGLAQGVFFALGLALVLVLLMLGATVRQAVASIILAAVLTVLLAVFLGTNAAYNTAVYVGAQLPFPLNSGTAVGMLGGLVIGAVVLGIIFARIAGRGGLYLGLFVGAAIGSLLGLSVGSAPWTWPPAVGFALTIGLVLWPLINFAISWPTLDLEEYFSRLSPKETIAAVTETREWLQNQAQSRLPRRGRQ